MPTIICSPGCKHGEGGHEEGGTRGYAPNYAARMLRKGRTGILTMLMQDLANPLFVDMAVAARAAAEAKGYELEVVDAGHAGGGADRPAAGGAERQRRSARAVETVLELMAGREIEKIDRIEPAELVMRESCGGGRP